MASDTQVKHTGIAAVLQRENLEGMLMPGDRLPRRDNMARRGSRIGEGRMYALGNALRPRLCRAFTLVEMLIVIAILAILASFLLPALRRAIREGHELVCMNNIRQLCVAATTYTNDYNGDYPPPVAWRAGTSYQLHPHELKEEDIWHLAPYIGIDPSQLDLSGGTKRTDQWFPAVMRCPFTFSKPNIGGPNTFYNTYYNMQPPGGIWSYSMGYAYFGSLKGPFPTANFTINYGVRPGFERKFASRNCDPDAALWGDAVTATTYWAFAGFYAGFSHNKSGSLVKWSNAVNFADFDRQNLGYVDGSVKIRWWWEVQPNTIQEGGPSGYSSGNGNYCWWF